MTRYELFKAPKPGATHVVRFALNNRRTLCGKLVANDWTEAGRVSNGRAAEDKSNCQTCRARALREHLNEINSRSRVPDGQMYVSLKTRGV